MRRTRSFPAVPQSVHAARRFTTDTLAGVGGRALEAVELMVSELATNCIRHEGASFHVAILSAPTEIRVEVTDGGSGSPQMRSPGPDEPRGRGLQIVNMLSDRWGVEPESPTGKTVWFTLDVTPGSGAVPGAAVTDAGRGAGRQVTGVAPRTGAHLREPGSATRSDHRPTVQRGRVPQASNRRRRYCAHEPGRHARRRCRSRDAAS